MGIGEWGMRNGEWGIEIGDIVVYAELNFLSGYYHFFLFWKRFAQKQKDLKHYKIVI